MLAPIAPWLNPANPLAAMEGGANIGLQARGLDQNMLLSMLKMGQQGQEFGAGQDLEKAQMNQQGQSAAAQLSLAKQKAAQDMALGTAQLQSENQRSNAAQALAANQAQSLMDFRNAQESHMAANEHSAAKRLDLAGTKDDERQARLESAQDDTQGFFKDAATLPPDTDPATLFAKYPAAALNPAAQKLVSDHRAHKELASKAAETHEFQAKHAAALLLQKHKADLLKNMLPPPPDTDKSEAASRNRQMWKANQSQIDEIDKHLQKLNPYLDPDFKEQTSAADGLTAPATAPTTDDPLGILQ
jgi:hypothetical protein